MKPLVLIKTSAIFIAATLILTGCTSTADQAPEQSPAQSDTSAEPKGQVSLAKNFYFVFDGSGSMDQRPQNASPDGKDFVSKLAGAKWAVREFLRKVPSDVNLGLYVFDDYGSREVLPLGSNNREQFLSDIDQIKAGDATPLGAAIRKGAQALENERKKQLGYGEYRLIVITDGEATDNLDAGVDTAENMRVPIYTIGFDIGQDHDLRRHSISYRSADSAKDVEQGLEQAAAELDVYDPADFKSSTASK